MIQLTHLGRRTDWNKGDWLPSVSSSRHREPAHRAFPKLIEDWDIERIITDFADAAERMQAGGMDGIELQVYGHLLDQFWSPLTNDLDGPYGARYAGEPDALSAGRAGARSASGWATISSSASATPRTRRRRAASRPRKASRFPSGWPRRGQVDFLNVIRGRIHTDPAMTDVIPVQGMKSAPHLDFAGEVRARHRHADLPRRPDPRCGHRAPRGGRGAARHGRHDPRAHGRSAYRAARSSRGARTTSAPASAPPIAWTGSIRRARRCASTTPPPGAN